MSRQTWILSISISFLIKNLDWARQLSCMQTQPCTLSPLFICQKQSPLDSLPRARLPRSYISFIVFWLSCCLQTKSLHPRKLNDSFVFIFFCFLFLFFPSCWSAHALSRSISTKMQIVIDNLKTRVMIPWYERDAFAWQGWGLWFAASSYEYDIATTLI